MSDLADLPARRRTLEDLGSTLIVEAAAGTGKTALMAGRVTMLLASGAAPSAIAAITFTELAASSLSSRVHQFVGELLAGQVPLPLRCALSNGLDERRRSALASAAARLDELTTTTIHGFCQAMIKAHAVEADIDPGAVIIDADQADAAMRTVFETWLQRRLSEPARSEDPIATLARNDPQGVASTLRNLSDLRLRHRRSQVAPPEPCEHPEIDFLAAVADFRAWIAPHPAEPKWLDLADALDELTSHCVERCKQPLGFAQLWALAHPPSLPCFRDGSSELVRPSRGTGWWRALGREGSEILEGEAEHHFALVDAAWRRLMGVVSASLLHAVSVELDEVAAAYAAHKRAAAVLDFDDLLERARSLVAEHEHVRAMVGDQYRHILVDEFQDTDPQQAEILFRIAAAKTAPRWQDCKLRPGALFLVGDPRQAVYLFRGADVRCYEQSRDVIIRDLPDNLLRITFNFRSTPGILSHVNRCFDGPLQAAQQPGYVPLRATHDIDRGDVDVVRLRLTARGSASIRNAEADAVADACGRLVGKFMVRDAVGACSPLSPGGIALVSPTYTDLWRYERAIEARGFCVATQAGKSFFRRQEVQDLLALARVLADARDTLALGALLRGPLIGLSEEDLLDVTAALPPDPDRPDGMPRLSVSTDLSSIAHPLAHRALSVLQSLRRRAVSTTPANVLAEAVERLSVRAILSARDGERRSRSLANVDEFLERARRYDVRGLKSFVRDVTRDWRGNVAQQEGRVDVDGDAIEIITMHSAKGLEWPVVIPINTVTEFRRRDPFVHRSSDSTLHWLVGDVVSPELQTVLASGDEETARERVRLWYVSCTRARNLLILPEIVNARPKSWARVVDLQHRHLPDFAFEAGAPGGQTSTIGGQGNRQTREVFAEERRAIQEISVPILWRRPSEEDADRMIGTEPVREDASTTFAAARPQAAGRVRGLLLHKLMEEILTEELQEDRAVVACRAGKLLEELVIDDAHGPRPDASEVASTIMRTLDLPDVRALRSTIIAEIEVYSMPDKTDRVAVAGRIDALAHDSGGTLVVLDWKSDVAPSATEIRAHEAQLAQYLATTRAARGAIVYMTSGEVRWIDAKR